jgi:lysophospholipase L1-like esterase
MKKFLLILALTLSSTFAAEPGLPPALLAEFGKKWPQNRAINLVFHGHSVPSGYHKTPEVKPFESYPHLLYQGLKQRFPHAVINIILTSIGGENSIAGEKRFERDVLTHKPDVIFIDYALNDRRQDTAKVEAAWRSMVRMAKGKNIPVVLLTPTGDSSADLNNPQDPLCQRAELIRRVAKTENVPLADVFAAWQAEVAKGTPQADLLSQVNHPNLRGHQLAANEISRLFTN